MRAFRALVTAAARAAILSMTPIGGGSSGGSGGSGRYVGPDPYTAPSYLPPSYYFRPQDRTITSKQIQKGTGSSTKGQKGSATQTQPEALTVPQLPQFVWLLLPLGMIILVAVAYAVFEPEPEIADEPLPDPSWRSQQPTLTPAPIALAGLMLQAATKTARRGFAQVIARRRDRGRSFRA